MSMEMPDSGRNALVHLLPTCGGTQNPTMLKAAEMLAASNSSDFYEALGVFGQVLVPFDDEDRGCRANELKPLEEIIETAMTTTGKVDLESVVLHFSCDGHTRKFDNTPTIVGRELPEDLRAFAHTLLPLTVVRGKYFYNNGEANVEIRGLVQFGPSKGTPYAHLAGLVWLEDGGLSVNVHEMQATNGLTTRVSDISVLDYGMAPILSRTTREAKEAMGL